MSEEIFDVVNERDEVIDRRPRSEVHARGLLHRATHVLVFNSRGEVFWGDDRLEDAVRWHTKGTLSRR